MQPTGELNQRGRVQRLKEGAVHAREVDRGVLAHRLHSESDQRPRRYPDHPLWVTSPQFGQGEVNGYADRHPITDAFDAAITASSQTDHGSRNSTAGPR